MSDIFISYTHKDNATLSSEPTSRGWVHFFNEALKMRLDMLLGRDTQIWRDNKGIDGTDMLTPKVEEEIRRAQLLISILSPGYVASEWCNKELELFCEAAKKSGGLAVGTKARLVKVLKMPVDLDAQAAIKTLLADLIGYSFYRDEGGRIFEYDPRFGDAALQAFWSELNELSYAVCNLLKALSGEKPVNVTPSSDITVYLAETGYDLADDRERLRRELQQFGHTVLPDAALPYTPEYAERVKADLARSRFSIHPIGATRGVVPSGADERDIVELQYALAGEEAQRRPGFTRVPWMPPGLQVSDPHVAAFSGALQDDQHLLVCSLEAFKTSLSNLLTAEPQPPPKPAAPAGSTASVYLVRDASDAGAAKSYADWLLDKGLEVVLSALEGDECALREDHEENLKLCDAVLIYNGHTEELWRRAKIRDLLKAFGYGRQKQFLAKAVLLADPQTSDKREFRSNELRVLQGFGAFDPAVLSPFVADIMAARGEAV